MSAHWTQVVAELERERAELDNLIAVARKRAASVVEVAPRTPEGNGHPKPKRASVTKHTGADVKDAKRRWDAGESVNAIAQALGVRPGTVYAWSSKGEWKRRTAKPAPQTTKPTGAKLAGAVRCTNCQVMTEYDPCQHCHKALKRTW